MADPAVAFHFVYVAPNVCGPLDELFVVTSSLQIERKKSAIHEALLDVVQQVSPTAVLHTASWPAISDPWLQVADYVTCAIQRKHVRSPGEDLLPGLRTES